MDIAAEFMATTVNAFVAIKRLADKAIEGLLATAAVSQDGWVDLTEPIIVRSGEAFVVVPESDGGGRV